MSVHEISIPNIRLWQSDTARIGLREVCLSYDLTWDTRREPLEGLYRGGRSGRELGLMVLSGVGSVCAMFSICDPRGCEGGGGG